MGSSLERGALVRNSKLYIYRGVTLQRWHMRTAVALYTTVHTNVTGVTIATSAASVVMRAAHLTAVAVTAVAYIDDSDITQARRNRSGWSGHASF